MSERYHIDTNESSSNQENQDAHVTTVIQENLKKDLTMPFLATTPYNVLVADIEPNAKLLYGILVGLSHQEGYCWASNAQLAKLFKKEERQIIRWIKSLEKNGFIQREIQTIPYASEEEKLRWKSYRKIYVNPGFQKICGHDKNVTSLRGYQKCHPNSKVYTKNTTTPTPSSKKKLEKPKSPDSKVVVSSKEVANV